MNHLACQNFHFKFFFFVLSLYLVGCGNAPTVFLQPRNQMDDFCTGWFINTPTTCVHANNANSLSQIHSETGAALILLTEPGNLNASAENLEIMSQAFPEGIRPYFRTLQNNVLTAYVSLLLRNNGRKYSRIYVVRSEMEVKSLFLSTLTEVSKKHSDVDMLLAIHGNKSTWSLDPTLSIRLSSNELISFAQNNMSIEQRRKIRSVFSTACYGGAGYESEIGQTLPSMSQAVVQAFPRSVTYGSFGVNSAQIHRDFIAFEAYYKGTGFATSVLAGNEAVLNNFVTGDRRRNLNMPLILGYGCGTYSNWLGSYTQCGSRIINVASIPFLDYQMSESLAQLNFGSEANLNATIGAGSFPEIQPGAFLFAGQCISAGNNYLCMQTDGNLVVSSSLSGAVWGTSWYQQNNAAGFYGPTAQLQCAACYMYFQYDGNLVLYNPAFNGNPYHAYWASNTQGANLRLIVDTSANVSRPVMSIRNTDGTEVFPSIENVPFKGISGGFYLTAHQCKVAGSSRLCMQSDGNLVLSDEGQVLWATSWFPEYNAQGFGGKTEGLNCSQCSAVFQSDGNLVLYNPNFHGNQYRAYWASNTYAPGARMIINKMEPPFVRIYRPDLGVIFAARSDTSFPADGGGY